MSKNDYLKPINLSDRLWLYVEKRTLCIVTMPGPQTVNVTWKRLDRLRKQIPKQSPALRRRGTQK